MLTQRRERSRIQSPAQRWSEAGYAALIFVLALSAVQCARLGAAGLYVQLAQFEIDRWSETARAPTMAEIKRATEYFSESLGYASDNPWALEGAGALDLSKMRASRIPREAFVATKDAHALFRQALQQRPTSPFLWANLALTKLYLNEIDGELAAALRHAEELGPWEPSVQQTVLFVGLAAWPELDPGLRHALQGTIERGALRSSKQMFEIVKSYRRFDLVCAIEEYKLLAVQQECVKAAAGATPASR